MLYLDEKDLMASQEWSEELWDQRGAEPLDFNIKLSTDKVDISIVAIFKNKYGEDIAYWLIKDGSEKPFLKKHTEIAEAIKNKIIKLI